MNFNSFISSSYFIYFVIFFIIKVGSELFIMFDLKKLPINKT